MTRPVAERLNKAAPCGIGIASGDLGIGYKRIMLGSGRPQVPSEPLDQRREIRIGKRIATTDENQTPERLEATLDKVSDIAAKRSLIVTDSENTRRRNIPGAVKMEDAWHLAAHPAGDLRRFGKVDCL